MPATKTRRSVKQRVEPQDNALVGTLIQLAQLVQHVVADVSRTFDLTPQQANLICSLVEGPVGMTALSRQLHLEKSSLTGLVDRVERLGLITRVLDPEDRRACLVELTDEGIKLRNAATKGVESRIKELTNDLSPEKHALVSDVLADLVANN